MHIAIGVSTGAGGKTSFIELDRFSRFGAGATAAVPAGSMTGGLSETKPSESKLEIEW